MPQDADDSGIGQRPTSTGRRSTSTSARASPARKRDRLAGTFRSTSDRSTGFGGMTQTRRGIRGIDELQTWGSDLEARAGYRLQNDGAAWRAQSLGPRSSHTVCCRSGDRRRHGRVDPGQADSTHDHIRCWVARARSGRGDLSGRPDWFWSCGVLNDSGSGVWSNSLDHEQRSLGMAPTGLARSRRAKSHYPGLLCWGRWAPLGSAQRVARGVGEPLGSATRTARFW